MAFQISDLWNWRGTLGRAKYFGIGVSLFAIKHLLDRIVSNQFFGLPWSLFNYWIIEEQRRIDDTPFSRQKFYATLVALALPFIWVGLILTIRRLRSIGWPLWLVTIFFVPFVNLLFFLLLSTLPAREPYFVASKPGLKAAIKRIIPRSSFGSAIFGVTVTTFLTILVTILSVHGLATYGWGLFVGLPFCLGFSSVLIYGYHQPRSFGRCLLVSLLSVFLAGCALIAVAIEGVICVAMAMPLGIVMALFGGAVGYIVQCQHPSDSIRGYEMQAVSVVILALPALLILERKVGLEPTLREVRTTVEIRATKEEVWQQLVAFAELPPPQEWMFQTGIAFPIRAEINGTGRNAVRHCIFSTGAFVEPIEVWDEPTLLKFGVTAQPPVMDELSPYTTLRPPHLNQYLRSRKGQFQLTRLSNGNTLLEGTTWYQNGFWPEAYWTLWSDYIIHRIHQRVLNQIKLHAES
jgi:hypothetical protein